MSTIGNRIEILLRDKGMKQAELSRLINCAPSHISQIITKGRVVSPRIIQLICDKLHVNREWLEEGKGPIYAPTEAETLQKVKDRYNASETFRTMLDVYARLPAEAQEAFERYIAELSAQLAAQKQADTMPEEVRRKLETKDEILGDAEHKEGMNLDGESDGA